MYFSYCKIKGGKVDVSVQISENTLEILRNTLKYLKILGSIWKYLKVRKNNSKYS